jgi:2,5-diamino-6-(ribosylamino)-4(3H)-pyrimidinone 5'-phosphate reductase
MALNSTSGPAATALTIDSSTAEALAAFLPDPTQQSCTLTLTYAQSLDGQIALSPGTQTALSGQETKAMTHYLRYKHEGILVGVGTAEADDPGLNCRFDATNLNQEPGQSGIVM